MKSSRLAALVGFAFAALAGAALYASAVFGQGSPGSQLSSLAGGDIIAVTRAGAPFNNFVTANQVQTFINGGDATPRNVLLGGDFLTNPFQRGTSQAANISNTLTYGPDNFWFLGGASSAIQWSQQTGGTDVLQGFGASLRFQRASANADTAAICKGSVLESGTSVRFQGQTGVYSFWAQSGANWSATAINVTVASGTGSNQSSANFAAGTWTGFSSLVLTPSVGTAAPAAGIAQSITSSFVRYSFSFPVAATATQLGVKICWTPVGTAGANDWIETIGEQLEVSPGLAASPFDYHVAATELNVSQRRLVVINEPAASIGIGTGLSDSTTTCLVTVALPDTMASAPTVTFAGTALSGTTWQVRKTGANTALSTPFLAANTGHSLTNFNLTATTGATQVAGQACILQGAGGGGKIVASSEL
jgi:hypothetical protein